MDGDLRQVPKRGKRAAKTRGPGPKSPRKRASGRPQAAAAPPPAAPAPAKGPARLTWTTVGMAGLAAFLLGATAGRK